MWHEIALISALALVPALSGAVAQNRVTTEAGRHDDDAVAPAIRIAAALDPLRFDGSWQTTVSCPNASEALAYFYEFTSQVKDSVLRGQRGVEGKPGWLNLDGRINPDGTATIQAKGLVGNSAYAQGNVPAGNPYNYRVSALFEDTTGTGDRLDGRVCHYTFVKQ
jgi:hypothetical protein